MQPEIRGNFADILDPSFRTIFYETYGQLPQKMPQIFNVLSSSKNIEKDSGMSGFGKMIEKGEGAAVQYEGREQGYDVTYTHKSYALGDQITHEMMEDDQFGKIRKVSEGLARAAQRTTETHAADIFNYGFTVGGGGYASFTGGDSLALFDSTHSSTVSGVSTQSNVGSGTHKVLSEDALEEALVAMRGTLDLKGEKVLIQPNTLVIPPALEKDAYILLKSSGRVGTTNNDTNPYQDRLNIVVWDFLTSSTAWFVLDKGVHQLNWFWREKTNLDGPETDFDTKNLKYSVLGRWSVGFSDWRGTFGSEGDGTSV